MSDELDVMSSMASLNAIDANRISVRRVAGLAPVEVVHREGSVTRNLVQTLPVRHGLFHRVLVVEYLVPAYDGLHTTSKTKSTEPIVENLIEFERRRGVIRDLNACRQTVENPIPTQNRMALRRYQNTGLGVAEYIVFFEDALAAVENANAAVATVKYLVPLERGIRVRFNPNTRHCVVEYLVLFEQTQSAVIY